MPDFSWNSIFNGSHHLLKLQPYDQQNSCSVLWPWISYLFLSSTFLIRGRSESVPGCSVIPQRPQCPAVGLCWHPDPLPAPYTSPWQFGGSELHGVPLLGVSVWGFGHTGARPWPWLCPWARRSQRRGERAGEGRTRFSLYLVQAVTKSSRILSSFRELIFWIQVFLRWGDVVKKLFIMEFILGSNCLPAQYQKGSEKALQWW